MTMAPLRRGFFRISAFHLCEVVALLPYVAVANRRAGVLFDCILYNALYDRMV